MEGRSELDHPAIHELFESLQVTGVPLCKGLTYSGVSKANHDCI